MDSIQKELAPFVREPGEGPVLNVLGVTHIYKAMGRETGGRFSLWEAVIPPGAGAPPHTHAHEDEAIYVISGELTLQIEGVNEPVVAKPGGFFYGRRGKQHSFVNAGTETVRALIISTGAGLDSMFTAFDALPASDPPPFGRISEIAASHGVTIAPPA